MERFQPEPARYGAGPGQPGYSAVFFTAASGMGCGLLALLGAFASGESIPSDRWFGLASLGFALGAVTLGLVSWSFRSGPEERALRAFSRWRSSWPSRARVLAAAAYVPAGLFAVGWIGYGEVDGIWRVCGLAAALLAGFTVYATAMIYAARQPVLAWSNRWVVPLFLALALYTGALWLNALLTLFGGASPSSSLIVVVTLFLCFYLKRRYWRLIDAIRAVSTPESTTEPGGTGGAETDHSIDRERAVKLRRYAFVLLFALPLVLAMAAIEAAPWLAAPGAVAAALSGSAGVVVERWLFFAEAAPSGDA